MSRNYKFHNPDGLYFVSFATVYWIDLFVRRLYFECLVKNINYCIAHRGMQVYAWCIMPSHVHLVFRSAIQKPEELRDFKSYTAKELILLIKDNLYESRREWLLNSFKKAAASNSNNTGNQFWQQHNKPIELWSAVLNSIGWLSCPPQLEVRIIVIGHAGNFHKFQHPSFRLSGEYITPSRHHPGVPTDI